MKHTHQSNAQWPNTVSVGEPGNISTDKHYSYEAAYHVCHALKREGLGGERKVFPIRVWVTNLENGNEH